LNGFKIPKNINEKSPENEAAGESSESKSFLCKKRKVFKLVINYFVLLNALYPRKLFSFGQLLGFLLNLFLYMHWASQIF
jgi:hypothetical protein